MKCWLNQNINSINNSIFIGVPINYLKGKLYFNEIMLINIIKFAIVLRARHEEYYNSKHFGIITNTNNVKRINCEPNAWIDCKKSKNNKKDFVINNDFNLKKLWNDLAQKKNEVWYYPIYVNIMYCIYSKIHPNENNNYFINWNQITMHERNKITNGIQNDNKILENCINKDEYIINEWECDKYDWGYVILTSNIKKIEKKYWIVLSGKRAYDNDVYYELKYKKRKNTKKWDISLKKINI